MAVIFQKFSRARYDTKQNAAYRVRLRVRSLHPSVKYKAPRNLRRAFLLLSLKAGSEYQDSSVRLDNDLGLSLLVYLQSGLGGLSILIVNIDGRCLTNEHG